MIKARYKRGLVRMINLYGSNKVDNEKSLDIAICTRIIFPKDTLDEAWPKKGKEIGVNLFGKTLAIDLRKSEKEIFADIHKNTKYKINRASKRDNLNYHKIESPTNEQLQAFLAFFDAFAKHKKITPSNLEKLISLRDQGSLTLSFITDENENILCYHVYFIVQSYCTLLHSASARFDDSEMRNLIGRANRFLHWKVILDFKEKGLDWYNFGGLFMETNSIEKQRINRFKREFGGIELDEINSIYSFTLLGRLIVYYYKLKVRSKPEYLRAKIVYQKGILSS